MKKEKSIPSLKGEFSTQLALVSFAIGTILLVLEQLTTPININILLIGMYYVLLALFLNGIMLIHLLYQFVILAQQREYIAIKILILMANIPITYLYIQIVFNKSLLF